MPSARLRKPNRPSRRGATPTSASQDTVRPSRSASRRRVGERREIDALLAHQARVAEHERRGRRSHRDTPRPGSVRRSIAATAARFAAAMRAPAPRIEHRARQQMLAARLQGGSPAEHLGPGRRGRGSIRSSRGRPAVSVPVLSKATTSIACARSSASASRMRMPRRAAAPLPAMMAVGVARPSAQGQAMTSTATAYRMAAPSRRRRIPSRAKVIKAMATTTGTKTALTRSTRRWIGAFFACADSTRRTMRASVDLGADRAGAHQQRAARR